ncbi:MAG: hypothetical protein HC838_12850, partial [Spirulinaceae cyanobacterium RM2_2_10]|nr:hypothetical protein [Spirulinaceae cyanobacterium RM2_2_10]
MNNAQGSNSLACLSSVRSRTISFTRYSAQIAACDRPLCHLGKRRASQYNGGDRSLLPLFLLPMNAPLHRLGIAPTAWQVNESWADLTRSPLPSEIIT